MSIKIGINGFGRIGRNIFRALSEDKAFADIEVVGINDLTDIKTIAHLLKYDSVMGVSPADITGFDKGIIVDGQEIRVTNHRNPADIPWKEMGAEYVLECTGLFRDQESAGAHIDAGAAKVIISAPAKGGVKTFVMGVNEDEYDPTTHHVVSNASCTTNCLAPVAQVILNNFGIKQGLMTTVHAYTGDQRLLDFPHSDLRRARAAAMSMIPTNTGAASAVALVIPELKNKVHDLGLYGYIQGRGRLIGNENIRFTGKCHAYHYPLAHPAGQLMGILCHDLPGIGDTYLFKHLQRRCIFLFCPHARKMQGITFCNLPTYGMNRV